MQVLITFLMTSDGVISKEYHGVGKWQNNQLSFLDNARDTFNISFFENEIHLERIGFHPLLMKYSLGKKSVGKLSTDNTTIELNLYTNHLLVEEHHLDIEYSVIDEEVIFSKHHILMDWEL
ncbi:MAG: DUF1934 family protein [Candidatus Izemoplasmatales bacterium]|jgi:hypothetical protein|nr:DUF1934 family protein [Candidatus Izemoplasmatales bacterium]